MKYEADCLSSGRPPQEETKMAGKQVRAQASWKADYPGAVVYDIPSSAWTYANRPHDLAITYVVIHYTQGESFHPISFGPGGLAHYGVGDDGSVDQYIQERYIAWHAGNWYYNQHSVGVEHTGYGRPQDWTEAKLRGSAKLVANICERYRIPIDRSHIIGHSEVPDADHTDPGPNFPWLKYMRLVRNYLGGGSPTSRLYRVQCGAFGNKQNAEKLVAKLKSAGYDAYVMEADGLWRVQTGAFTERKNAENMVAKLKKAGFDAIVVGG
ncbi:N-acetylmuramoyl-L-alanine amidase [Rubrobacter calidifluminis]|uniref:N-acetylmuramoyl-L-alanine amidase n=1 Tax=Rubrobacter calidifluminis TaxID=1392640 RepID=UPI0023601426|nr:N-acetylmuramoyl-L-alanine amidase [Rubrobacter calidifluminis]